MKKTRIASLAVLTAFAITLTNSPPSIAKPLPLSQATQVRVPVNFTIPAGQCPNLAVTVQGSGELFSVINTRVDQDGMLHINRNDLVTGTATDSDGATYVFNYHLHAEIEAPPSGFPFTLAGTDHFNLNGKGNADNLHVGFVARAIFTSPADPPTIEFVNTRGNPFFCDPL